MQQPPTRTYAEFTARAPLAHRSRAIARDLAIRALAIGRRIGGNDWVRFIYYHHVFTDEQAGFARQLRFLAGQGEFISLDDALSILRRERPRAGRYFCVGFDDGLKSCATGALPVLAEMRVPAVFYVVSDLVGRTLDAGDALSRDVFGFKGGTTALEFMSWEDCRALATAGMTIGSHSRSHARLSGLDRVRALAEMADSKRAIERELGRECLHFCAPYGLPGRDFDLMRDPALAREAGYASFASGARGAMTPDGDPFLLRRDHLLANWGEHQLRYFLSRG
ncbi:MAG: polysaccharide deacetylase family protein [Rhodospirillales bacterium]|nr:polysaccharide deacetylase family protein [Rhodospirillales bacterium]